VFASDKQTLKSKPHPLENPYFSQQLKIMQFTGRHDKNRKEIYEGDILKLDYNDAIYTMKWNDMYLCYDWEVHGETEIFTNALCYSIENAVEKTGIPLFKQSIVIGNIYENPELLT